MSDNHQQQQQPLLHQAQGRAQDVEHNVRQQTQQAGSHFQRFKNGAVEDAKHKTFVPQVLGEFYGQILFNYLLQTILISVSLNGGSPLAGLVTAAFFVFVFFVVLFLVLQPVTGAFVNPSITLNFFFIGRLKAFRALSILSAQFAGAIVGALLVRLSYPNRDAHFLGVSDVPSTSSRFNALIGEIVGTFIFNLVIVAHTDSENGVGAKAASVTIAATLGLLVFVIAPISGASLNPARSFGPAVVSFYFSRLWIYLIGPSIGGILAGQVYTRVFKAHQQ